MLALETGWTPDVLRDLPTRFRAACHWALFARVIAGPEGFPSTDIPRGAPIEVRQQVAAQSVAVDRLRRLLNPEDATDE